MCGVVSVRRGTAKHFDFRFCRPLLWPWAASTGTAFAEVSAIGHSSYVLKSSKGMNEMENAQPSPLSVVFYRLFWVLLGPVALFLTAASILLSGVGWLTGTDLLFGVLLLATIFCRWGDFLKGNGTNALGDPVTERYMWGYTYGVLAAGLALWTAANFVGNHLL